MAGTLESESGELWSGSTWLFHDILLVLATLLDDGPLKSRITEILDNNLGWFSLRECTPAERQAVCKALGRGGMECWEKMISPNASDPELMRRTFRDALDFLCGPPDRV